MSLFITFEGLDGSGKSTQARLLYERLQGNAYPAILTREPGGTRISELIRRILVDLKHTEMAPTTETLLFSAARAQLVSEVIRPYLETGGIVLCDRYADSTYAYQGYGLGRDLEELRTITRAATGGLMPDITIYLDLSAEEGLDRKRLKAYQRNPLAAPATPRSEVEWNRLDARELAFHKRIEGGYAELRRLDPERWRSFDARLPIETLAEQVYDTVAPLLSRVTMLGGAT